MSPWETRKLLVIDDDVLFCDTVAELFADHPFQVISAHTREAGRALIEQEEIHVVLLDQQLPDGMGVELCGPILDANDQAKIIFITAHPSFDNAVHAIRNGAFDYLLKPMELEELELVVNRAFRTLDLEQVEQIQVFKTRQDDQETVFVGQAPVLDEVAQLIALSAGNEAPVLITGETGTGKNLVAKTIHYRSGHGPVGFMDINCAALPENLIESELFGHEKGAFTGAGETKKGIFELARDGTLFLDEIGDLPAHLQSKLLGVLDGKRFKRIGGQAFHKVEARIISATNVDLESAIADKSFRQDLYYRLSVLRIHLPPLRARPSDIPALCEYFMGKMAPNESIVLTDGELDRLMVYPWPGNVRELKNIIERALILRRGRHIHPSALLAEVCGDLPGPASAADSPSNPLSSLAEMEEEHIRKVLAAVDNNHTHGARILGISRSTLIRKLKTF